MRDVSRCEAYHSGKPIRTAIIRRHADEVLRFGSRTLELGRATLPPLKARPFFLQPSPLCVPLKSVTDLTSDHGANTRG